MESVQYRSIQDSHIIEGNQYSYDEAGDRTQEIQLSGGPAFGERYLHDSASRLVDVQYGVQDLADPNSSFQVQVRYDLDPVGIWQQKTVRDSVGQTISQVTGAANARDA